MLMLIDTREPPGDDGGSTHEPWLVALLGWALPWPALIVWLCAVSRVVEGWAGVAAVFTAIAIAAWRGLRALPADGLDQVRQ